jgi:hypothetical protein
MKLSCITRQGTFCGKTLKSELVITAEMAVTNCTLFRRINHRQFQISLLRSLSSEGEDKYREALYDRRRTARQRLNLMNKAALDFPIAMSCQPPFNALNTNFQSQQKLVSDYVYDCQRVFQMTPKQFRNQLQNAT